MSISFYNKVVTLLMRAFEPSRFNILSELKNEESSIVR